MEPSSHGGRRVQKKRGDGALGSESDSDEPLGVERLMGIAMGCMGMSMDDFCRCAPSEFYAAWEAWEEMQQRTERGMWERARMQCLCALQPYSKKTLRAQDVMQFPWEKEKNEKLEMRNKKSSSQEGGNEMSHEQLMARYREAKRRAGLL